MLKPIRKDASDPNGTRWNAANQISKLFFFFVAQGRQGHKDCAGPSAF